MNLTRNAPREVFIFRRLWGALSLSCHCEEQRHPRLVSLRGATRRGNLMRDSTGDCHGRRSRPRNDSRRYKRLPRPLRGLAMTYRSCRPRNVTSAAAQQSKSHLGHKERLPVWYFSIAAGRRNPRQSVNEKALLLCRSASGDPYGTRTHVTAVKGRCLNHLTNGPGSGNLTRTDDNTGMNRVLYQLSYAAIGLCCWLNSKMNYKGKSVVCQV